MSFTFTSGPHQTVQRQFPPNKYRIMNTGTWGSGGNTCVITDPGISPNSVINLQVTGTGAQAAGNWSYSYAAGTCTVTSNNSESSSLPLAYFIE